MNRLLKRICSNKTVSPYMSAFYTIVSDKKKTNCGVRMGWLLRPVHFNEKIKTIPEVGDKACPILGETPGSIFKLVKNARVQLRRPQHHRHLSSHPKVLVTA
jgi:hypothetical protein